VQINKIIEIKMLGRYLFIFAIIYMELNSLLFFLKTLIQRLMYFSGSDYTFFSLPCFYLQFSTFSLTTQFNSVASTITSVQ